MSRSILIIEDDADVAEALAMVLGDAGYSAEIASDGAEGLERLRKGALPSLILLDLMMPGMDGWEFRREQLRMPEAARIPVVLLSADTDAERKAREMGCDEWLRKPVHLDTLVGLVRRVFEGAAGHDAESGRPAV